MVLIVRFFQNIFKVADTINIILFPRNHNIFWSLRSQHFLFQLSRKRQTWSSLSSTDIPNKKHRPHGAAKGIVSGNSCMEGSPAADERPKPACSWDHSTPQLESVAQHRLSLERLLAGAAELDIKGKSKKETQLLMQVNIEDNFFRKKHPVC
jgi:hypothetical protein